MQSTTVRDTGSAIQERLYESPVFICGHYRSGTSLLQSLLDGHPNFVVSTHESYFFSQFYRARPDQLSEEQQRRLVQKTVLRIWDPEHFYYQRYLAHIAPETVEQLFWRNLRATPGRDKDYLPAAILAFAEASGQLQEETRYWVEKTPGDEHYAALIFSWWQRAKCIHVVRDPRALHASFKKRSGGITMPGKTARKWLRSVRALHENETRFGTERYLPVRYEDIVLHTEREMRRIADFLDIDFHNTLLSPSKVGGEKTYKGNSATGKKYDGVSADALARWRSSLEEEEVAVIEILLAREMQRHGYAPEAHRTMRSYALASYQYLRALLSEGREALRART